VKACVCNVVCERGDGLSSDHELTRENHARYANQCEADYKNVLLPPITDWSYCHWKYEATKIASEYDITLYLDSDCIVTRKCPDFRYAVPIYHWGIVDELWTIRPQNRSTLQIIASRIPAELMWQANGGVLIMPPSASQVYHREDWLQPDWVLDQMLLSWRLQSGEAPYRLIDKRWNWSYMRFKDFYANISEAFIIHHAGQSHYESHHKKLESMRHSLEAFGL
jgi:hypothetical protein